MWVAVGRLELPDVNVICQRRNHSMIESGRKMMLKGKGSWKPLKNWNEKPKNCTGTDNIERRGR